MCARSVLVCMCTVWVFVCVYVCEPECMCMRRGVGSTDVVESKCVCTVYRCLCVNVMLVWKCVSVGKG